MGPQEFEHVIAAAAEVTSQDEFVVIGSQAILGSVVQPPASLLQSLEADIYPLRDPAAADLIDGALGDGSPFHLAFGYYAHGVSPETAKAPKGWQDRLAPCGRGRARKKGRPRGGGGAGWVGRRSPPRVPRSRTAVAWCLEVHDLV